MAVTYSTYEAKARFSEVLRQVRAGQRVVITYRGESVAEIRRCESADDLKARLRRAEEHGTLAKGSAKPAKLPVLRRAPGGLRRFLESRD